LGDGLSASFRLESGINITSGAVVDQAQALADNLNKTTNNITGSSQDGQLFGRESWVALGSRDWGTLTFGRQYALFYDIYKDYDPVQFAALFTPLGFSGGYQGSGGVSENLRQDGAVRYSQKWGAVNFSSQYKFGGIAGNNHQNSAYGFRLGYEGNGFGIQAAWQGASDVIGGSASGTAATPIKVVDQNLTAWLVTGRYLVNSDLTLKGGYQRYWLSAPSDPLTSSSPGAQLYNGFVVQSFCNVGATQAVTILDLGGDYNLTERLNLALGFYAVNYDAYGNGSTSAAISSTNVTGNAARSINYVSALLDYRLSKRTDTYVGYLNVAPGGLYAAQGYANNAVFGAGVRHRF
jgi:predicted porin